MKEGKEYQANENVEAPEANLVILVDDSKVFNNLSKINTKYIVDHTNITYYTQDKDIWDYVDIKVGTYSDLDKVPSRKDLYEQAYNEIEETLQDDNPDSNLATSLEPTILRIGADVKPQDIKVCVSNSLSGLKRLDAFDNYNKILIFPEYESFDEEEKERLEKYIDKTFPGEHYFCLCCSYEQAYEYIQQFQSIANEYNEEMKKLNF